MKINRIYVNGEPQTNLKLLITLIVTLSVFGAYGLNLAKANYSPSTPNVSDPGCEIISGDNPGNSTSTGLRTCDLTNWDEILPKLKEGVEWHTFEATEEGQELCGLKEVECEGEKVVREVPTTAYNSFPNQTDESPCIAADGSDICKRYANGEVLYATNDIPLGTKIAVNGVIGTVADRMNKRYTGTGRVDVYMGYDLQAARAYGVKTATLEILK